MKAILLLASLVVISAQVTDLGNYFGYDIPWSVSRNQDELFQYSYPITAADLTAGRINTTLYVKFSFSHNPTIRGNCQFYASDRRSLSINGFRGTNFASKANNNPVSTALLPLNNTGNYYIGGTCNCNQCNEDGYARGYITARFQVSGVTVPFRVRGDAYTTNYTSDFGEKQFHPPGWIDLGGPDNVYVVVDAFNPNTEVIVTFSKDAPMQPTDALPTVETDSFKRYPAAGTTRIGSFGTGGVYLPSAGRWYVAPYVNAYPTQQGVSRDYRWALAIGREPDPLAAANPAAVCSLLLIAILSILASLGMF